VRRSASEPGRQLLRAVVGPAANPIPSLGLRSSAPASPCRASGPPSPDVPSRPEAPAGVVISSAGYARLPGGNSVAAQTLNEDAFADRSECWCCGAIDDPARMVHLGNHPEVALCIRCARWASKEAWEIEDRRKTGLLVRARDRFRTLRRGVVLRGWHHHRLFGGPLRWIGRKLP
jgi:hypothetical protein